MSLEILDSRELYWVLDQPERLSSDLALLRNRCQQLHNAPGAADLVRFPGLDVVSTQIAFNRAYRQQLAARLPGDSGRVDELSEALREVDRLYEVWDALRDARYDSYYIPYRRQALRRSRSQSPLKRS